ncbi:MAG: hypothetical protein DMG08_03355 [Acidobacteria bacterium]|nr:MAG: hypothetical protein DMG08_03355 [Acidobacteriota bacterium]PYV04045.1 MAG: hypothetical protein DMG10_09275 [Acidobacteriota bacterium]PYV29778.1 MAG: hypothetical protein DMG09_29065 [Acidobacteriota bacterium]
MKQGGIASALFDNNAFAKLGPKSRTHRFRDPWHRGKGPRILLCYRDLEFGGRAWITGNNTVITKHVLCQPESPGSVDL